MIGEGTDYAAPFKSAFDAINRDFRKVPEEFNKIIAHVNDQRWKLGPVMWWIKDKLESVRKLLAELMKKVTYALEHYTPVISLISASFSWLNDVKTPISELSSEINDHRGNENFAYWTGPPATAYSAKAAQQKAAVDEAEGNAEFISQWLFKIAKSNVDYAVALAQIVTKVLGKLVQAAIDTTSIIDIPWAIDALAEQVGDLVAAGANQLLTIGQRFVEAVGNVRDLASRAGDHSVLTGGKWPEAVTG